MGMAQSFYFAFKSLMTSKVRSLLTMLGIIIGVGAVIVIISLGDGMKAMITDSFESLGTNMLVVNVMGRNSSRRVTDDNFYELEEKYPEYISAVSPYVSLGRGIKYLNETFDYTSVSGVNEEYLKISNSTVTDGRYLQYIDISRMLNVCVVGSYIANDVLSGDAIGKTIRINGINFTVIGVLDEKADSTKASDDDVVYIPYTRATRIVKNSDISMYYASAVDESVNDSAKWALENMLYGVYEDEDAYMVVSMAEVLDMVQSIQGTLILVLVAIAAISLLVGGVGIMNIMLVSVTERTREIGIRKSLGAKRSDIRSQFIIEAGTTSAIGGIIGIILGVTLANAVGNLIDINAVPSVTAIVVSFSVSVGVGVIFGYLPANKAAKLNPIDALRYE